jgi:ubiquinone/menaquinone biosynthesis C-methylase UbiE
METDRMSTTSNPPVQSYSKLAVDYDEIRFVGKVNETKERLRREGLLSLVPPGAERTLDVACGTGRGVAALSGVAKRTFGLDGTAEMLRIAQQKLRTMGANSQFFQGNAAALPFRTGVFDAVTCLNFVHLFPELHEKRAFVEEMGRVTKPGGVVIVEFDSALQGLVLGPARKYFVKDIGYDWPWVIRGAFPSKLFEIETVRGVLLPGAWRLRNSDSLHRIAKYFPFNYLATRVFVRARRR